MTVYKRLIAQVHDIDADTPQQADEIAHHRAHAANRALRPLGMATVWAPCVSEADGADGKLLDILTDAYVLDEIDDNPEKHPRTGYVPAEDTTVPERLIAWRDAAVKAATAPALDLAVTRTRLILREVEAALAGPSRIRSLRRIQYDANALLAALNEQRDPHGPGYQPVLSTGPADPVRPWLLSDRDTGLLHYETGAATPTAFATEQDAEKYAADLHPAAQSAAGWDEPLPQVTR